MSSESKYEKYFVIRHAKNIFLRLQIIDSICRRRKNERGSKNGNDVFSGFYVPRSWKNQKVFKRTVVRWNFGDIQGKY